MVASDCNCRRMLIEVIKNVLIAHFVAVWFVLVCFIHILIILVINQLNAQNLDFVH